MNRVQTVTQKYHRFENQSKKPSRMHKHPASPAGTPRCALARPGVHWRAQARAWLQYHGRVPGRVIGQRGRVAATVSHAPRASARTPAPSAPAPAPQRQRPSASACSPSTLARTAYRAPSAVMWPPSRSYRRAQRRVAARPWPYHGLGRAPGLRPACPACQLPSHNTFLLYCS